MLEKLTNGSKVLEKSLDAAWLRNETISQNIANVDTPGYKRKAVVFEEFLNQALEEKKGKASGADNIEPRVVQDHKTFSQRLDGNNVDVDHEMADMAKNTIKYNVLVQSLNSGFRRLKSVISEGRK